VTDGDARAAVLAFHAKLSGSPLSVAKVSASDPPSRRPGVDPDAPGQPETALDPEALAEWEERAAILEYDGGFSRAEAERWAKLELWVRLGTQDRRL